MSFPITSYLSLSGELSKSCKHKIPKEELIRGLEIMLTTQQIDARMLTLQRQGAISFALSSRGEEAAIVASAAALQVEDWVFPQYRECGVMFWRGYAIEDYLHQMFCNAADAFHGRQMPNHFGSRKLNVVTVSSPLASKIPHAAGAAYAMKLRKEPYCTLCYFGEGAASKGDFHTGINFAAVRKTPTIFFCRNNQWAISTPVEEQFAGECIAMRGPAYGIDSYRVDGNDYFAVHEAVTLAKKGCLEGRGPALIEAMTYRLGAHSTSDDPTAYRSDDEVKEWEKKDPIPRLRRYLEKKKWWSQEHEEAFLADLKLRIDNAINIAQATGHPSLDSLIQDVCFEAPESLRRQLNEVKAVTMEV